MHINKKRRCGIIANETTLHKRPNDTEINNCIGHRTAFNNEKSRYCIFIYKRPRNDNVKQCKRET